MPFMPGSIRSSRTRSGRISRTAASACVPSPTTCGSNPSPRRTIVSISASAISSSTTRIFGFMVICCHLPVVIRAATPNNGEQPNNRGSREYREQPNRHERTGKSQRTLSSDHLGQTGGQRRRIVLGPTSPPRSVPVPFGELTVHRQGPLLQPPVAFVGVQRPVGIEFGAPAGTFGRHFRLDVEQQLHVGLGQAEAAELQIR